MHALWESDYIPGFNFTSRPFCPALPCRTFAPRIDRICCGYRSKIFEDDGHGYSVIGNIAFGVAAPTPNADVSESCDGMRPSPDPTIWEVFTRLAQSSLL